MNGECKSFRMNDPMSWDEFKSMPDDLKVTYIKLLRQKFRVPDCKIGEMLGVNKHIMSYEIKRIGLGHGEKHGGKKSWDKEGFLAWANGVDKLPTPVIEEPAEDPAQEEPENFAEEDIPWIVPEPIQEIYKPIPMTAVPTNGSMTFKCPANLALNTLKEVLANEMVELSIMWRVVEEMSGEA